MMRQTPSVTDRELEILERIWDTGPAAAQDIAAYFLDPAHGGHNKNTTYTFLNRLVKKGAVERREPGFVLVPLCTREEVQAARAQSFLDRVYHGSVGRLFMQFVQERRLTQRELRELQAMIDAELEKEEP